MGVRTGTVGAGLAGALAITGCASSVTGGTTPAGPSAPETALPSAALSGSPTTSGTKPGRFTLPKSACDLADAATVERLSGRSPVAPRVVTLSPPKQGQTFLSCAFTAGFTPVGALTVGMHDGGPGVSAGQELDDSVSASEYATSAAQDVPGVGDAARYATTPSLAGITYATIWVVQVRGTQVLDLSITSAAKTPATAKDPLLALARSALARL